MEIYTFSTRLFNQITVRLPKREEDLITSYLAKNICVSEVLENYKLSFYTVCGPERKLDYCILKFHTPHVRPVSRIWDSVLTIRLNKKQSSKFLFMCSDGLEYDKITKTWIRPRPKQRLES